MTNKDVHLLVEGSSMRSVSRVTGVSINTVTKLLVEAGRVCAEYHDRVVREVSSIRIQCDEIWAFTYAKARSVPTTVSAPPDAGDAWTWTALDPDTKLIVSWLVGGRTSADAIDFLDDLRARLEGRIQLTTDGFRAYLGAVEGAFGGNVDYAQMIKMYGPTEEGSRRYSPARCVGTRMIQVTGRPDSGHVSTSLVERHNLTMRMSMRRFTRLTNAFSKKIENHRHALALYFVWYNFVRRHMSLGTTPAVRAGLDENPRSMEWIVGMVDERRAPRAAWGSRRSRGSS